MPTVRQGPKPSGSRFVIRGPLNSMPRRRLHSRPPQPPQKHSLSYSQGGRLQSADGNCAFISDSLIRPSDVYLPIGEDGMAVSYDVTVVSPVVEYSLSSSAKICRLRDGNDRAQESRTLCEQLRWLGDKLFSASAGDARCMVYPDGKSNQSPCGPH
jgi:hypothetical protein